jgi:plasmid maintenance system antidote protein VapI
VNEKASVSIEMVVYRLSKAFGSTPETWLERVRIDANRKW